MNVGVVVVLRKADEIDSVFKNAYDLGFKYCQLICWNRKLFNQKVADEVLATLEKYDLKISTFWCGWSGPTAWNFVDGPHTLGLVPECYRFQRMQELMEGSDFAKMLGVDKVATHVGFMPENPSTEHYHAVVAAIRVVASHCKANGQNFLFETGQETPVTILRVIEDSGCDNLGVNLDPANLIMYGKANPVDALDVIGKYVYDVHGKDGKYPTCGKQLGPETPIGEGAVNFPAFIGRLKELGYDGTITIEREISGEEQKRDILKAKEILEGLF